MRIAYFTAGGTGAGHLTRGLAIGNALRRASVRCEYVVLSATTAFAQARAEGVRELSVVQDELEDEARAKESELARALDAFDPDLLLVDMYWAPLHHLLPRGRCEAWLLLRWVPPPWLRSTGRIDFDPRKYARTITIEPMARVDGAEAIEPIVVCNRDEMHAPEVLRARLSVADDARLILVLQAGRRGEAGSLAMDVKRRDARDIIVTSDMYDPGALFPIAPYLAGADRIYGGVGYNLFWETRWLGLSARAELYPFDRTIDDQLRRLTGHHAHAMRENGADALVRIITGRRANALSAR